LDSAAFEAAAQDKRLASLQEAVDLYKGDLLPVCYQDWILPYREHLRQLYLQTLERLSQVQEAEGRFTEAILVAQRLLHQEPLREETYRLLMRLHARNGDQAGVVRIYHACTAALQAELGIEPSPETQAAFQEYSHSITSSLRHSIPTTSVKQRTNLPTALDSLVGREGELAAICELVAGRRLLTLTGFGGVGKTRLALAAGAALLERFPDGVWLLELAPLSDPAAIAGAAATALKVAEQPDRSPLQRLAEYLNGRNLLLILDNCEHLLDGAAQLTQALLQTCQNLRLLATSRVSLRLAGEAVYAVQPLPVPALAYHSGPTAHSGPRPPETQLAWQENPSVKLFVERATLVLPTFTLTTQNSAAVDQICRRLDGIPLAIELAAARARLLTPQQIAARLDNAFQVLRRFSPTALPRHQTLGAVLDWSYDLLTPQERILLRRLAVFAGDFSLEAIEAIASDPHPDGPDSPPVAATGAIAPDQALNLLANLEDHSLVAVEECNQATRFRMHEVTRQYALEKIIQSGELEFIQQRHLDYYCQLVEKSEPMLRKEQQLAWLQLLDQETDNIRQALRWGLRQRRAEPLEKTLRIIGALWMYWFIRGRYMEGLRWGETALSAAQNLPVSPGARGKARYTAAASALFMGHLPEALAYSETGLLESRQAGDLDSVVVHLHHLGLLAIEFDDFQRAAALLQEGLELARSLPEPWLISLLLADLGYLAQQQEDWTRARAVFLQGLTQVRQNGDRFGLYYALLNLAETALGAGELEQAAVYNREAVQICRQLGDVRAVALSLDTEAKLAARQGQIAHARSLWQECLEILWEIRDRENTLECLEWLAWAAAELGEAERAAQLLSACQAIRQQLKLEPPLPLRREIETLEEHLRQALPESALQAARSAGQVMDLEEAVEWNGFGTAPEYTN
jgi:predicted ATPase